MRNAAAPADNAAMGLFAPEFDGQLTLERLPEDFAARIRRRVDDGLFVPGSRHRADYRIMTLDRNTITFVAAGFLTTYNVGLNEVTVRRGGRNQVQYHVAYWGWTRLAAAHGALLGLVFALCYALVPSLRAEIGAYPYGLALSGGIVGFFSLAWPWILSALHRRPAERALQNILRATLSEPAAEPAAESAATEARYAS